MKKLLFLLTAILVLLATSAAVSAENAYKVYLAPVYGTAECYRTQEIQLVLKAQDITDLYTAQFEISYDPTRLELSTQNIQNLAWPDNQNGYTGIQLNAESGKLKVIFSKMSTSQGTSGNFDIRSLKFKTKVIGKTQVNIDDVKFVNPKGEYIDDIQASGYEVNVLPNPLSIVLSGNEGNDGWYTSNVQVKVTDIDAAKVEYLLNGTYGLYSSEFTISDSGFYKLTVTTDDGYGYIKQKSVEFKIDNIKPTAALLSEAKEWQNTDITVAPSYSDAGYSGLKQSMYKWSNDLDIPSEWDNYTDGNLVQTQDGIWYLHMKAVDGAGNVTVQTYGPYGIDRIAPSLSIEPAERDWDNADVVVTPLYTDEGGSNIKSAAYSWSISPDTTSSLDNHTAGDVVQSRDGVWYLYMKVEDNAGNVTESTYGVYKVDKTPPAVTAAPNNT